MKINWTGKTKITTVIGGVVSSGAITMVGGVNKSAGGNQNIVIGNGNGAYTPENVFTIFREDTGEWMRYKNETNKAQVKLSSGWVPIEPHAFKDMHQLDLGAAVDTKGKEDLAEIREQYEEHIKNSPWLERLRNDYDDLVEKHKLFDAIKGEDDEV